MVCSCILCIDTALTLVVIELKDYSPRLAGQISNRSGGKYDIEALVQREVARQDEEEYNKLWERIHGQVGDRLLRHALFFCVSHTRVSGIKQMIT